MCTKFVDIHAHVLPAVDDGAQSAEESLAMLEYAGGIGIDVMVATPHCYIKDAAGLEKFLAKRAAAYSLIAAASPIKIVLGAEVNMCADLARIEGIERLCIGDTNYMLVEMPYSLWREDTVENVYALTLLGIRPIMAHIERFTEQPHFGALLELPLLYQITADTLYDRFEKGRAAKLIESSLAQFIGSDTHNNGKRINTLEKAYAHIEKKMGGAAARQFAENARLMLANEQVPVSVPIEKKGLFGKAAL